MNNAVQLLACLVIRERLGGQGRPIQRSIGQQNVVAECLDQRSQPLGTGLDHLSGDDIAVDDDPTALREGG